MNDDRLIVVDIETTGLVAMTEQILEIGVVIINAGDFSKIDERAIQVWSTPVYDRKYENMIRSGKDDFVLAMHQKSGLWDDARANGVPIEDAEDDILSWLKGYGEAGGDPMVGSSIAFDRGFLQEHTPELHDWFHYRNIDVSSIKELCRRLNPGVYSKLEEYAPKREAHRVISDCEDTISELSFYRDNFMIEA